MKSRETKNVLQVNKAVSFHTIKNHVIRLIFDPPSDFEEQVTNLFLQNPTAVRPERKHPPRNISESGANRRSLYFQRYAKKHVF